MAEMRVIQKYVFPEQKCIEENLYYRVKEGRVEVDYNSSTLSVQKDGLVAFDTYLNSFSAEKWYRYTGIQSIYIKISGHGYIELFVKKQELKHKKVKTSVIYSEQINIDGDYIVGPIDSTIGVLTVEVRAMEDVRISRLEWCSECDIKRKVRPAIIFCTYKREKEITYNLNKITDMLNSGIFQEFCDLLHVYVVDNGKSLCYAENSNISVYSNPNCGGSGGFARGLYEALNSNREHTHYLLMDDDVEISAHSLLKTMCLLSSVKEEYVDYVIGGQMLNLPEKNIQHENGGFYDYKSKSLFKNDRLFLNHRQIDLGLSENVFQNELKEYKNNIPAWFYCCIPKQFVRNDNLPLPLFIHMDDVEYSVRNQFKIITMNGIYVWHPQFVGKASMLMQYYYDVRNRNYTIIYNAKYSPMLIWCWIGKMTFNFMIGFMKHNYERFIYVKAAYEFVLNGPEYFANVNAEPFHLENKRQLEGIISSVENCFAKQLKELFKMIIRMLKEYKKVYKEYSNNGIYLRQADFWKKQWKVE